MCYTAWHAGGILIRPGAFTKIINSSFTGCSADITGGGISTAAYDDEPQYFEVTQLSIDATFVDNSGTGRHIWAGPMFKVKFPNKARINGTSPGVLLRKSLCGRGEYKANSSGFCERCNAYTYSLKPEGHTEPNCDKAPNNTYAPGGAVFVPNARYWHGNMQWAKAGANAVPSEDELTAVRR